MYRKQRRTLATRYLLRYQQNPSMSQNERKLLSLIDNGRINSPVGQQADVCWRNCRTSSLSPFRKDIFSQAMDRTNVKLEVWLQVWGAAPLTAAAACSFKVLESGTNKEHSVKIFFYLLMIYLQVFANVEGQKRLRGEGWWELVWA